MRDKITISYILATVVLFAVTLVYFANLDFKEMNNNIESGGKSAYKQGKHYSDKLYTMVSKKWEVINSDDNNTLEEKAKVEVTKPKIRKKIVFNITKSKEEKLDKKEIFKESKVKKDLTSLPIIFSKNKKPNENNGSEVIVFKKSNLNLNFKKEIK